MAEWTTFANGVVHTLGVVLEFLLDYYDDDDDDDVDDDEKKSKVPIDKTASSYSTQVRAHPDLHTISSHQLKTFIARIAL